MLETLLIVFLCVLIIAAGLTVVLCIRKIQPGRAGLKTGWGGLKVGAPSFGFGTSLESSSE